LLLFLVLGIPLLIDPLSFYPTSNDKQQQRRHANMAPATAATGTTATATKSSGHERRPSTSAPIVDLKGPVGPSGISRPKHKRTATGFGAQDIKTVEASIPEPQRAA
jgi:hypothetical protein